MGTLSIRKHTSVIKAVTFPVAVPHSTRHKYNYYPNCEIQNMTLKNNMVSVIYTSRKIWNMHGKIIVG